MDLELTGKVAIVGGASKGLGRACAQVLADEGAKLALCSRSQKDLDKAAQEIHDTARADVLAFAGDLDRPETVRDLVAATVGRFGRLDILVNNSGGPPLARAHNATEEQWATALQRSLLFFARMSREAVPHLKQAGGGRIVTTSSRARSISPSPTSRSPGRRAWAWWRSRRASRTRSAATGSSSTTCAPARS
jgi:3-oxoacyl-[acyl-carrier protein] reductase